MSRGWKHTDLSIGEEITLPDSMFEMPLEAKRRMIYCRYVGETETGLIIEIQYEKSFGSELPLSSCRVQKFIDFAAIWCGAVVLKRADHTTVRVERKAK